MRPGASAPARAAAVLAGLFATGCDRRPSAGPPALPAGPAAVDAAALDAAAPAPLPPVDESTLLGGERGLDHVGIAVKDLEAATRSYRDLLGFNRPSEGKLPNGVHNVNYYFADSSYLETLVPWDRQKAAWLAAFTDHHSGALFAVLSVGSPAATTAFLGRRGITASAPWAGSIEVVGKPSAGERWQTFFLPEGLLAGDPLYFIAYPRGPRADFLHKLEDHGVRRAFYHDNTALGLRAVWIAVPDLDAAARTYASIGLRPLRAFTDAALGARGQAFEAGAGEIWLLSPRGKGGALSSLLRERGGAGLVGVTLLAGSVPAAAALIASRTGRKFPAYPGQLGNSIRVPPDLTHGVWLEFTQYLVPAAH